MNLKLSLDWKAQLAARKIAEGTDKPNMVDNLATKTLGILQENGLFPCVLFLHTRRPGDETALAKRIMGELQQLAEGITGSAASGRDVNGLLEYYTNHVCGDLDKMLLTATAWEQALIYTRYWAKARHKEAEAKEKRKQPVP